MSLFLRSLIRNALGITGHFSVQNGAYHDVGKACFWHDADSLKSGLIRYGEKRALATVITTATA
jgi:hypothetical protein